MAEEDQYSRSPVPYNPRTAAAQKFQEHEAGLPIQNALELARLQHAQAQQEFEGRAQLDAERTQANTLRQGAAFYAAKPVLEKYLRDNNLPVGSPGHAEAYANFAAQFPYALRYLPDVAKTVQEHAEVHDLKAKLNNALSVMPPGTTAPEVIAGEHGETSIHLKAPDTTGTSMEDQLKTGYGLQPNQFKNAQVVARGTADAKGQFVGSDNGPLLQVAAGETKTGQPGLHVMSINEYNGYAKAFGGNQFTPQNTAQPAAPAVTGGGTDLVTGQPSVAPASTPAAIPTNSQGVPQPQPNRKPLDEIFGSQ